MLRHALVAMTVAVTLIVINPFAPTVLADRKDNKQALKQTMRRWAKEMGVKCGFCHVQQGRKFDYEAPTHHKAVSLVCADEFVEKLRNEKGERLSCATCHTNKAHHMLPRPAEGEARNEDQIRTAVSAFCQEHYVAKLKTAEGAAINCATCHKEQSQPANFFPAKQAGDGATDEHKNEGEHRDRMRPRGGDDDDDHEGADDDDDDHDEHRGGRREHDDDDDDDDDD